jgi:PLP dependent protein
MNIQSRLIEVLQTIPDHVKLVAVSKTKPAEAVKEAYDAGQRIFGENKMQEMLAKQPLLPDDIEWHFIGHLQTNKVKFIATFVSLIHAVDSLRLFKEISKQAKNNDRIIDCLIQFHIADEYSKFGLTFEKAVSILNNEEFKQLKNIRVVGVMGMSTFTDDMEKVRKEFKTLKNIFTRLKNDFYSAEDYFKEISMGMSGDYKIAIEEGSTMVRIGTSIFGVRGK